MEPEGTDEPSPSADPTGPLPPPAAAPRPADGPTTAGIPAEPAAATEPVPAVAPLAPTAPPSSPPTAPAEPVAVGDPTGGATATASVGGAVPPTPPPTGPPSGPPGPPAGPDRGGLGGDWPEQAADAIVNAVGAVRDRTTGPIMTAARGVVFGLFAGVLGAVLAVLVIIGAVRFLDEILPSSVWLPYLVLGVVFVVAGALVFRKRNQPAPAAGNTGRR